MDIKLRARLSAYSKIDPSTADVSTCLPTPTPENAGDVVGVNTSGQYTLFPRVSKEQIDSLFATPDTTINKEQLKELLLSQGDN